MSFERPEVLEALRQRTLMTAKQIDRVLARMAHEIIEPEDAQDGLVLVGVRRGGENVAYRLADRIAEISGERPALGFLNVNLYRDDDVARSLPESAPRTWRPAPPGPLPRPPRSCGTGPQAALRACLRV